MSWINIEKRDFAYEKAVESKAERDQKFQKAKEDEVNRKCSDITVDPLNNDEQTVSNDSDSDNEFKAKTRKVSNAEETIALEVPKNILRDPDVVSMLDRTKCSSRMATGIVSAILKASGADLNNFNISKDTTRRQRNTQRIEVGERVKSDFNDKKPMFACLHWDSKLTENILGTKDDRIAVLLSGGPNFVEGKLLGIPKMVDEEDNPTSTGEAQYKACAREDLKIYI